MARGATSHPSPQAKKFQHNFEKTRNILKTPESVSQLQNISLPPPPPSYPPLSKWCKALHHPGPIFPTCYKLNLVWSQQGNSCVKKTLNFSWNSSVVKQGRKNSFSKRKMSFLQHSTRRCIGRALKKRLGETKEGRGWKKNVGLPFNFSPLPSLFHLFTRPPATQAGNL